MSNSLEKLYEDFTSNSELKDYGKTFRDPSDQSHQLILPLYLIEEFGTNTNFSAYFYFYDVDNSTTINS